MGAGSPSTFEGLGAEVPVYSEPHAGVPAVGVGQQEQQYVPYRPPAEEHV